MVVVPRQILGVKKLYWPLWGPTAQLNNVIVVEPTWRTSSDWDVWPHTWRGRALKQGQCWFHWSVHLFSVPEASECLKRSFALQDVWDNNTPFMSSCRFLNLRKPQIHNDKYIFLSLHGLWTNSIVHPISFWLTFLHLPLIHSKRDDDKGHWS